MLYMANTRIFNKECIEKQYQCKIRIKIYLFLGIGASLFGLGVSSFWFNNFCKKNPDELKQSEIEFSDERNTMIRNKAKAKVGDIIQWLIMGIAYITIVIDAPLWVTLVVVGVFLLKNALEVYFMNKFQKEL